MFEYFLIKYSCVCVCICALKCFNEFLLPFICEHNFQKLMVNLMRERERCVESTMNVYYTCKLFFFLMKFQSFFVYLFIFSNSLAIFSMTTEILPSNGKLSSWKNDANERNAYTRLQWLFFFLRKCDYDYDIVDFCCCCRCFNGES